MSRLQVRWTGLALMLGVALGGCGAAAPTGDLDALTTDENGNGFLDVTPPDGVEFLTLDNVKVRLHNTITTQQLGSLAAGFGVEPSLLNLVEIVANMNIALSYGDGINDELVQSETIEPFDRKFEVACPEAVTVDVNVVANVPVAGPQSITDFNVALEAGVEYNCGQTINVEVFVNERGDPDVAVSVE